MKYTLLSFVFILFMCATQAAERPNIVWIIPDDMSANFSCYGETAIETPNVDRLAARGVKFTNAYVTAPVCSTCRSAFITGMYQTSIGAHHTAADVVKKIHLPAHINLVQEVLPRRGILHLDQRLADTKERLGKTDYNFEWDQSVYEGSDWSGRAEGSPFSLRSKHLAASFAQGCNGLGASFQRCRATIRQPHSISAVTLPPYYPEHPEVVRDWAAYLDSVRMTDAMVGDVLARLESEGVLENTLVLFMTDHGISHARGKQFLYDEGLHVPLVIGGPGVDPGTVRDDVVEHIDIAALSLAAAGIEIPEYMQAKNILAEDYQPREAVFAARDRCDETVDHIRSENGRL